MRAERGVAGRQMEVQLELRLAADIVQCVQSSSGGRGRAGRGRKKDGKLYSSILQIMQRQRN